MIGNTFCFPLHKMATREMVVIQKLEDTIALVDTLTTAGSIDSQPSSKTLEDHNLATACSGVIDNGRGNLVGF